MQHKEIMSIDKFKYRPVSDKRFIEANKMYSTPLLILHSCPTDLIKRYGYYVRCSAGSDNHCNASHSCGRRSNQSTDGGRSRGPGFRDQNATQSTQPVRSGCPCRSEQPRRLDRPVDLLTNSSSAVSNRSAQIPRNRRSTYGVQTPPCGDQNPRRSTYDVEPEPQNNRLGTYDVSQPFIALQQNGRRRTYNVSQPCAAPQRNICNDVQPQPSRASNFRASETRTFTMTGTFQLLDGFQRLSPVRQPPRGRSSSCSRLHDTDGDIDDYLDNHLNYDMVAPRAVALPGQPYVRIDESAVNTTPDIWRQTLENRSSVDLQGLGIPSPTAYDDYNSSSRDTSGRRQWPSADRQSMPFGLNDSFGMNGGASSPRDRRSRSRSAAPECGSSSYSRRRRDTFDRNTQ